MAGIGATVRALLWRDARGVLRDRFLGVLVAVPVFVGLVMRALAAIAPRYVSWLAELPAYLAPFGALLSPMMLGMIVAFQLIEEREARTDLLLRVVPLRQAAYYGYQVGATTVLGTMLGVLAGAAYGVVPARPALAFAAIVATASTGPLFGLAVAALAANRIEAMVRLKLVSFAMTMPMLAILAPRSWQWLATWNPWYWAYVALLEGYTGRFQELLPRVPVWPTTALWLVPLLLGAAGSALLLVAYRRGRA